MSNLFATWEKEAFKAGITPRSKESIKWFRQKANRLGHGKINRSQLMQEEEMLLKNRTIVGSMFMYFYDPKHKKTLPYYDSFPLGIIVGPAPGGFHALNLHYIPPLLRAKFLDSILDTTTNKKYNQTTRFKLTYELLKNSQRYAEFKPCFKHYLTKHVRSRFALVQPTEWEIATFLPVADWQKASANTIYRDSRKMI